SSSVSQSARTESLRAWLSRRVRRRSFAHPRGTASEAGHFGTSPRRGHSNHLRDRHYSTESSSQQIFEASRALSCVELSAALGRQPTYQRHRHCVANLLVPPTSRQLRRE